MEGSILVVVQAKAIQTHAIQVHATMGLLPKALTPPTPPYQGENHAINQRT